MSDILIENNPSADDLWSGIGGHFDSFDQIICEFIDNSISNFIANKSLQKSIVIKIIEEPNNDYSVSIDDSGTGIKDLNSAFCLGSKKGKETPLNEHGFGMKHALASANPNNDDWVVCTRTQGDHDSKTFKMISAPYKIKDFKAKLLSLQDKSWPGALNHSGTYVHFKCSKDLFQTISRGIKGGASRFDTLIEYLVQDLGFIYAGLIKDSCATITIIAIDKTQVSFQREIVAVEPDWEQYYNPPGTGETKVDLGGGTVKLKYEFGSMKASNFAKYYKRNMSSSGLEIRINGRVMAYNLFKEVWGIERHNMYNHFLVRIDIISDDPNRLPITRTSKNGLREGCGKLEKIYEWVLHHMPTPKEDIGGAQDEGDLFDELKKHLVALYPDPKTIEREMNVYKCIKTKIPIDLYVSYLDKVIIFEGKKDQTSVKDVYQLKMYWDGCVLDALSPTEAILISANHPSSVVDLIKHVNNMKDIEGKPYRISVKTWKEMRINYPN